jgi:hypothetical protein
MGFEQGGPVKNRSLLASCERRGTLGALKSTLLPDGRTFPCPAEVDHDDLEARERLRVARISIPLESAGKFMAFQGDSSPPGRLPIPTSQEQAIGGGVLSGKTALPFQLVTGFPDSPGQLCCRRFGFLAGLATSASAWANLFFAPFNKPSSLMTVFRCFNLEESRASVLRERS